MTGGFTDRSGGSGGFGGADRSARATGATPDRFAEPHPGPQETYPSPEE
ncbi:hypothetical protein [Halorubrum sodomense]|nr:hypothetical protein [Halorubrum sodomense]